MTPLRSAGKFSAPVFLSALRMPLATCQRQKLWDSGFRRASAGTGVSQTLQLHSPRDSRYQSPCRATAANSLAQVQLSSSPYNVHSEHTQLNAWEGTSTRNT